MKVCAVFDTNILVSALVTGNIKHFPKTPIVVTPLEFLKKIGKL